MNQINDKTKELIIKDYLSKEYYMTLSEIANKYAIPKSCIENIIYYSNIPPRRFYQQYEILNDYAVIYIRKEKKYVQCKIDIEDIERCKEVGIWSLTKDGYILNSKNKIYLHRFIMDCPLGLEIDHIYHDLLDNRKTQLRIANRSQQIMNTKKRKDNTSGHRGVYYDKSRNTWNVSIRLKDKHLYKRYYTYEEACNFADEFYDNNFGEFRYNN